MRQFLALAFLVVGMDARVQAQAETPRPADFSTQTQLRQIAVRPAKPPHWLARDWRPSDFVVIDSGNAHEIAFLDSVLVPLDLVVISNLRGAMAPRQIQAIQDQFQDGSALLDRDDRLGGVTAEICKGTERGLVRRSEQTRGMNTARQPGAAEAVADPIGCAVQSLIRDEPRRAKSILVLSGGSARPLRWEPHLKTILANGITVYVCSLSLAAAPSTVVSKRLPRIPGTLPPSTRPIPLPDDGLEQLIRQSGGARVLLEEQADGITAIFRAMKDAMLLGYYPVNRPGLHEVRVELRPGIGTGNFEFHHQTHYIQ